MNVTQDQVGVLLQQCRQAGLRRTECLRAILTCLVENKVPVSVQQLLQMDELRGRCDPATVYRLLARLEDRNVIRRVGLPRRSAHYVLNDKDASRTYAVCLNCGKVQIIDLSWPTDQVLEEFRSQTGYQAVYHEAQFYGVCKDCQDAGSFFRKNGSAPRAVVNS